MATVSRGSTMGKVLVIDDDADIRECLVDVLSAEGHLVATASDGAEGLARLRAHGADVVLLDLMMPVMDGSAFLAALRADPLLDRVPVIVASAHGAVGDAEGASACLSKPYDLGPLLQAIALAPARG